MDTVGELMEYLGQYDEDSKLRVAYQPSYPLRAYVQSVISESEMYADDEDQDDREDVVWIAVDQDSSDPYAPSAAWSGC